ncbi:MAG TPA: DegT/DnrJ/EryC1/StrS family aminotransferase, partial [Candidatus Omnitrophota bacterium]|nr:DegT/DnrJ/EryC1/StrS family aminotransferase [Candidatus Omnitrophota bacterium]
GKRSSHHLYVIRLKECLAAKRRAFVEMMRESGIGVQVHYIPVYFHPYYRSLGYRKGICPVAENYYSRIVSIPVFPTMKDSQAKYVVQKVLEICGNLSKKK